MRRGWALALAAVGAAVLAGGGYVVGDRTGGHGEPSCTEVRQATEGLFAQWSRLGSENRVRAVKVRAAADIVLEHEDCYPFTARSAARAAVQQLDVSGDATSMQLAAGLVACEAITKDPSYCWTKP